MALQAVRAAAQRIHKRREDTDREIRVLVAPLPIDLTRTHTSVKTMRPYEITPLVPTRLHIRTNGPLGQVVTENSWKQSKGRDVLPGKVAKALTGGLRAKGVVEVKVLRGCENWPLYQRLQGDLYPESLGINDPSRQLGMFDRISAHLGDLARSSGLPVDEVEVRPGEFKSYADVLRSAAQDCLESNELGRTRRQAFFRSLQIEALNATVAITDKVETWAAQLGIRLPKNVEVGGRLPGQESSLQQGGVSQELRELVAALKSNGIGNVAAPAPELGPELMALIQGEAAKMFEEFKAQLAADRQEPPSVEEIFEEAKAEKATKKGKVK